MRRRHRHGTTALLVATTSLLGLGAVPAGAATDGRDDDAPPASIDEATLPGTRFAAPFVLANTATSFIGLAADERGAVSFTTGPTARGVAAEATSASFPGDEQTGPVTIVAGSSTQCLVAPASPTPDADRVALGDCNGSPEQTFHWVDVRNASVTGRGLARADAPVGRVLQTNRSGLEIVNSTYPVGDVYPADDLADLIGVGLTARVESVDLASRTAVLSGTALPWAYVLVDDEDEVWADPVTGLWSYELTGLSLGTTTVRLEQYEDGVATDRTTVDVRLDVAPLQVTVTFPGDRSAEAVLSGTAQPGAVVVVRDPDARELARVPASAVDGTWSTPVTAPDAGGDRAVQVLQEIGGEATDPVTATIAYGDVVSVSSPTDGMVVPEGPVRVTGSGERGSTVTVRDRATQTVVGSTTVLQNGRWFVTTSPLDGRRHVLDASQLGKGANTTTTAVTINPDAVTPADLVVDSPRSGEPYSPDGLTALSGTATPGSTVTVSWFGEAFPQLATTVPVDETGAWSATRALGGGSNPFVLTVTQPARDGVVDRIDDHVLAPPS
jgi:hypothetical protein